MKIALQSAGSMVFGLLFFGLALFVPAWSFRYWQAWVFIGVFMLCALVSGVYLPLKNPAALQRRLKAGPTAETRPVQRIIMTATILTVVAVVVVASLDHRFGWSAVPVWVVIVGDILVLAGLTVAQLVVIQNSYAAATITVEEDQPLVSTGLYGFVRHPMYVGVLIMMVGTPLALASYWALLATALAVPVLAARILDEEKAMLDGLTGYADYTHSVPYRLVPHVW